LLKNKDELMPSSDLPPEEQSKVKPFDPLVLDPAGIFWRWKGASVVAYAMMASARRRFSLRVAF
jgi:hypothetical protein